MPVIHLSALDDSQRDEMTKRIRSRLGALAGELDLGAKGGGAIDHIAFRCSDFDAVRNRIEMHGLRYRVNEIKDARLRQILVNDPNGVTLELNFPDEGSQAPPSA